jgi:glycosyltransferase involved in cell wall biosynthesis
MPQRDPLNVVGAEELVAKQSAVNEQGKLRRTPIHDVLFRPTRPVPHEDGYVTEVGRASWDIIGGPIVQVHLTTTLPDRCRAWGLHQRSTDRLFVVSGLVKFAVFDGRLESPTYGSVNEVTMSETSPGLLLFRRTSITVGRTSDRAKRSLSICQPRCTTTRCQTHSTYLGIPKLRPALSPIASDAKPEVTKNPFFSIVLPTYGRGQHIKPSIESVLGQSYRDFELIVVGDGCVDDTEAVVRSFHTEQITWLNLPHNSGSQSVPNNEGIRSSRGSWISYIGHDDIWAPHHLERTYRTIASSETLDFVVSGCVFYGPKDSDDYYVTGLFDGPEAPLHHFCPPTSISHRRDVTTRMGGWRDPRAVKCPADNEFLLRAAHSGLRFASTGEVTVHKFAAGHRYMSYLRISSDEQRELLYSLTHSPGVDIEGIIRKSKANGQYMIFQYGDYSSHPEGFLFEQNLKRKGISRPPLRLLLNRVLIEQTDEPRGLDWHDLESNEKRYRWSGPNPRPKILIPYAGHFARISIEILFNNPSVRMDELLLYVEERPVKRKIKTSRAGVFYLVADIPLRPADYTILTLNAPTFRPSDTRHGEDQRKIGIAVSEIVIEPIEAPSSERPWWRSRPSSFLKAIFS